MRGMILSTILLACGDDLASFGDGEEEELPLGVLEQPIVYVDNSCTTYQSDIEKNEVYALAAVKAAVPLASLNNGLYARWFGLWNSTRADTVQSVFDDVFAHWPTFEVDCNNSTCQANPTWSGYANADPDLFHLCALWLSLSSGTSTVFGTKAGTLTHEKVHVVSTVTDEDDDACSGDCYGAEKAQNFATFNASKAVNNADNYKFFAMEAYAVGAILPALSITNL